MKFILLLLVLLVSCSSEVKPNKKLSSVFETYWEERSKLFPMEATSQGDNRYNDLLPNDQTEDFRNGLESFYGKYLKELQKFNRKDLTETDKVSFDIFQYEMEMNLAGLKLDLWMIPFQQFWGLPLSMGQYGSGDHVQPFKTVQDYKNWAARLRAFGPWSDSAINNFRQGINTQFVLPRTLVLKMIPQMKDMVAKNPKKSLFYAPINKFPKTFTDAEKKAITKDYLSAINDVMNPSYQKLHDFLKKEYLPKARQTSGISALRSGPEIYTYLAKYWTTTDKTPQEIYETGLVEVERIKKEMITVKDSTGYKGDLKAFFKYINSDPKFTPYRSAEEVLEAFRGIYPRMEPQLKTMFGKVPKTPFEVRQTEAFRAESASAEYNPGSPDGTRPGIFYIPILEAKKFNITSGMESLFLHEAIPGHHYQVSLQQENLSLPKFRRFSWYGAYGEGWALYTESLGKELGLYTDPYQYIGALSDEMHRAVRLVVDVAIHTKNMTREEAIKYMMEQEPISLQGATAEIERYMAIPGQALSYKIGALKIWELRRKYNVKLSDFHDEYLADGCMPLAIEERKMDLKFKK
jgi:uncharacterized protein (DUF885 family)